MGEFMKGFNTSVLTLSRVSQILKEIEYDSFEIPALTDTHSSEVFANDLILELVAKDKLNEFMSVIVLDDKHKDEWELLDMKEVVGIVSSFFLSLDSKLQNRIMTIITEKKKLNDSVISEMNQKMEEYRLLIKSTMDSYLEDLQSQTGL
jgi:hypothetical protein